MNPPLVVPRDTVVVAQTTPDVVPPGAFNRAQGGVAQGRDFDRAGRSWREDYGLVKARSAGAMEFHTRLQWFRARSEFFWTDHQLLHGSGLPILGSGRENLVRDAAMDTDTDGDGVVDGFSTTGGGAETTFSVDQSAQKISVDGSQGDTVIVGVRQTVLRVFPGDEITASSEGKVDLAGTGGERGRILILWLDSSGSSVGTAALTDFTNTSFQRNSATGVAPSGAAYVSVRYVARADAGNTVDVWHRNARLLRASSDPATYANPHVSGASQTGDTLDTSGWPASTSDLLLPGDVFRVGGSAETKAAAETDEVARSFKVQEAVDSDANGDATITVDPPIFDGNLVPDGAALRFENMRLRAFLSQFAGLDARSRAVDKYGGMSATFVEAI